MKNKQIIFPVGFAMFAMFFGAGNLIFPLWLGAHAGDQLSWSAIGFIISGVLVPFLGLFAIALYQGDYLKFLSCLGKNPAFIISFVLIVLIGLIVGTPRTGTVAYATAQSFLPAGKTGLYYFNAVFFGLAYLACIRKNAIVSLLGFFLSPIKMLSLLALIAVGFWVLPHHSAQHFTVWHNLSSGLLTGYETMDLLAAFFFCAFIYQFIHFKTKGQDVDLTRLTLLSSLVGAGLLAIVYVGFLFVANRHSAQLQSVSTANMIGAVAKILLNHYAALFIAVIVSLACFSTALALIAVTTDFIYHRVVLERVHYQVLLFLVSLVIYLMSNTGFETLMLIALPILKILYPALLVLTVTNLLSKLFGWRERAWPFYLVLIISALCLLG